MPPRSRRALLALLGTATATVVAGCETTASFETDARTESPTPSVTPSPTPTDTDPATETDSPAETSGRPRCGPTPRPDAAWPVTRRSPAKDGYAVAPQGFAETPAVAWESEPSRPADSDAHPKYGRPVVAGGRVYLANLLDRGPQVPMYGYVHALDAGTGEKRWASERLRSPFSPVVWGSLVVVVVETESLNARLLAFDRTDGTRQWTREFAARESGYVSARDRLYLALEESAGRGTIHALADDGATVWRRTGAFADHVTQGPIVGPDRVYAATRDGRLHALGRDDGTTVWTHDFEKPAEDRPYVTDLVATGCAVFAVVEGAVHALDDDGTPTWDVAGDHGPLATDGEAVYVGADIEGRQRELRALNADTGEYRWSVRGPVETYQPPVVAGDVLLAAVDEAVVALDRADGTERWRTDGSLADVALADGTVYGIDRDTLAALR